MNLGPIKTERKTGQEKIRFSSAADGIRLIDFWQWSASDLLSNVTRGILAEFLVATDLGVDHGVRNEWDAYDLTSKEGIKVEVKTSAYLQSWYQEQLSFISFDIKPTKEWDYRTNKLGDVISRQSEVYVFCLLHHRDKETVDSLNLDQWTFYVLPTEVLDKEMPNQKRLSLSRLLQLVPAVCKHGEIAEKIAELQVK